MVSEPQGRISTSETPVVEAHASPSVWGLSVRELHDAYWHARGVQCVRCGEPVRLQRATELFLLMQRHQLVVFDSAEISDRLLWRNALVTRLRVVDRHFDDYSEMLSFDDAHNVRAITRRYRADTRAAHRVLLTRSRRIASTWMRSTSTREAWQRIRGSVPWSSVDHWRIRGHCFNEGAQPDDRACLNRIAERWLTPDQSVDGIESRGDGVWRLHADSTWTAPLEIGPAWIGHQESNHRPACIIGPTISFDGAPITGLQKAVVRPISQVELAPSTRERAEGHGKHWTDSSLKRFIDLVGSLVGLTLLVLLVPFIAVGILLEDGRPIFFGHIRQSRSGREFRCWKFRTMSRDAEEIRRRLHAANQADGPQFFMKNDPRVTRVGRLLRITHLDELPQLWNVLRGQMSLVGPRPSPDRENQFCPSWRDMRLSVRPGITGLWQVARTRAAGTDFQEWIRYDIEYVNRASFWLDIRIMIVTASNILRGGRAR